MRGGYFMNISHLVEKIKKGDNKSFEKLYKLTEREVWFTCISFLKNETTAQDIMQETYITAFLKIQSLEKSSQIRSWLNRIAVNKCKNYLKGKGEIQLDDEIFENQAIVDERISIPEEYISDKAKREIILSIMQEVLSDVQYQTVIMHYFNEMTVDEIAEVFECSRGTVLSRLNYSRAKMKTAIEDYENKSGDKLHGVVFVPFFTTIFREQAKSLCVPSIKITLPNGESLVTAASKGVSTAIKSSTATAVKTGAVTAAKTKAIAMACGMTLLFAGTTVGTSLLAGYKSDKVPTATTSAQTTAQATTAPAVTVPKAVKDLVDKGEIKVDKDGSITDKKGKKVEVKDGKVEVKTDDGKKVKVSADEVKAVNSGSNVVVTTAPKNSNSGNTNTNKGNSNSNNSSTGKGNTNNSGSNGGGSSSAKPAPKPTQKPAPKPTQKPTEREKVWVDDYKTVKTWVEPVTEKVWVDDYKTVQTWVDPVTHEEPVYCNTLVHICNQCGAELADINQIMDHFFDSDTCVSYRTVDKKVQTGTQTVTDKEGYYKTETVKDGGHYETKTVKKGYYKTEKVKDGGHYEYR